MGFRGTFMFVLLLAIAHLTKPTQSSLQRVAAQVAEKEAGAGVTGWVAGKLASVGLQAAQAANMFRTKDLLVTPDTARALCFGRNFGD